MPVKQCPLCLYLSPSLALHISHLRLVHSCDPSFYILCDIDGCTEEFFAFSSFNSHAYRRHRVALGLEVPRDRFSPSSDEGHSSSAQLIEEEGYSIPTEDYSLLTELESEGDFEPFSCGQHSSGERMERLKTNAGLLLRLTEGRHLSQVALSDVITGCRRICQETLSHVREGVLSALKSGNTAALKESLSTVPDPFEGIDSVYLREKFYKEHLNYLVSECIIS